MSDPLIIDGSLLRQSRDSIGWSQGELASRACLSVKQIKQLEEGGSSCFYSENVKLTAARKVAQLLGLSENEVLGRSIVQPDNEHQLTQKDQASPLAQSDYADVQSQPDPETINTKEKADHIDIAHGESLEQSSYHLTQEYLTSPPSTTGSEQGLQIVPMRSEVLHFLAQPPVDNELESNPKEQILESEHSQKEFTELPLDASLILPAQTEAVVSAETKELSQTTTTLNDSEPDNAINEAAKFDKKKESGSAFSNFLKIAIIFLLVLGVTALFTPKSFEERADAPPPLQVLPDSATTSQPSNTSTKAEEQNTPGSTSLNSAPPFADEQKSASTSTNSKVKAPLSNASSNDIDPKPKTAQVDSSGNKPSSVKAAAPASSDASLVPAPPSNDANKTAP